MSGKLTKAQRSAVEYLQAHDGSAACERALHPNTARALERRGILTIDDGDGAFRPWFDCTLTELGRKAPEADHGR